MTTIVDMPLNSIPPTVDLAALEVKRKTAEPQAYVDVGFWGGAVPGNVADLRPLHDAGVFGFKCFLLHVGRRRVPAARPRASSRPRCASSRSLRRPDDRARRGRARDRTGPRRARRALPRLPGLAPARRREPGHRPGHRARPAGPAAACTSCTSPAPTRCRCSRPRSATACRSPPRPARTTCPSPPRRSPTAPRQYKCCPPIRESDNREQLWEGLRDGTLDMVVSDHSPSTADLKCLDTGDFGAAWGGISSLQLGLSAVWTEARRRGLRPGPTSSRWMCRGAGAPDRSASQGPDRGRVRRRLRRLRPRRGVRRGRRPAAPPNPVTPYHGRTARRRGPQHLAARPEDRHRRGAARSAPDPRSRMSPSTTRRPVACPARPS